MNDEKVSLWLLDRNERFIQGTLDYSADENLYEEIEFLQKIVAIEEYREILVAAPHYICKFEIIEKIRSYLHHLVAMGGAEIHVVV